MRIKKLSIIILSIAFFCVSLIGKEIVCGVEDINGVPRIMIDGNPERARMLYVCPSRFMPGTIYCNQLKPKWRTINFSIPALPKNLNNIEAHFKTKRSKIDSHTYWISQFEITEKISGKKVYDINFNYPTIDNRIAYKCEGIDTNKTNLPFELRNEKTKGASKGALRIEVKKSSSMKDFYVYFKDINLNANTAYDVRIRTKCDGDIDRYFKYALFYNDNGQYNKLPVEYKSYIEPQVRLARDAGINVITFPINVEPFYELKDGTKPDYTTLHKDFKAIIENNPNAKILVRLRFYPSAKWLAENPDHTLTFSNGVKSNRYSSISSLKFREQSQKALRMIIDFAEQYYGKNVIGYHPGGANSCEWFYGDSHGPKLSGYDKSTQQAWNRWLLKKYATDTDLQQAWKMPNVQRATDKIPSKKEREATRWLINPQSNQRMIDFNNFWNDEMVDMIECLVDVINEKVPNKLCVVFYGYCADLAGQYHGFANSGHAKLNRILKNKKVHALCAPISYFDRKYGLGKTVVTVTETISRTGKIWIDEDDTSTHISSNSLTFPAFDQALNTREKTLQVLTRNMTHDIVRNIATWWMDLGGSGWFNDAELWKLKVDLKDSEIDIIKNGMQYENDIALIFDETSALYCAGNNTSRYATTSGGFSGARADLNRSGLTFGHYMLDDVLFGKPLKSKLDVYSVAYALTKEQRKAIKKRAEKNSSIFIWASGYIDIDNQKFSLETMRDITGFEMENIQDGKTKTTMHATELGKQIGLPDSFSNKAKFILPNPLFSPKLQKGDKVYATYTNGKPALVLRGKKLYCGFGPLPTAMYNEMARIAGIHQYTDVPAAVYTNGTYFSITPTDIPEGQSRKITFTIKENKDIIDVMTGEKLGTGSFSKMAKRGDTFFVKIIK